MDITVKLTDEQVIAAESFGIVTQSECQQAVDARFGAYVEKYRSQSAKVETAAAIDLKAKYDKLGQKDKEAVDAVISKVSAEAKEG